MKKDSCELKHAAAAEEEEEEEEEHKEEWRIYMEKEIIITIVTKSTESV